MTIALLGIISLLIYLLLWAVTRQCYWKPVPAVVPPFWIQEVSTNYGDVEPIVSLDGSYSLHYRTGRILTTVTVLVEDWHSFETFCAEHGALPVLTVGTPAGCVEEGRRILNEAKAQEAVPDAESVYGHSENYVQALHLSAPCGATWEAIGAFILEYPAFEFGDTEYTLALLEAECQEYYGTPYSGECRYLVVVSSFEDENAGTEDWPHLTEQAHENLCALLEGLYGSGEEDAT